MIKKARKKPVVIEYVRWTGDNFTVITQFGTLSTYLEPCLIWGELRIQTLEGVMIASKGDYIIKGINGEFYPCKPDIFEKTYDLVADKVPGRGISDADRERIKQAARKDFHQIGETLNDTINHVIDDVLNCPRVS